MVGIPCCSSDGDLLLVIIVGGVVGTIRLDLKDMRVNYDHVV